MRFVRLFMLVLLLASSAAARTRAVVPPTVSQFAAAGHTQFGDWTADVTVGNAAWRPSQSVAIDVSLHLDPSHVARMTAAGIKVDKLCLLVTAERTFDPDGWMRLPSDERMSTLLTPTGVAIEGGIQGAVTNRFGYPFRTPLDELATVPVAKITGGNAAFAIRTVLPATLPPGLYRLRLDFGAMVGTRYYNLNGYSFAQRPFTDQAGTNCVVYSPVIPASANDVSGHLIDATAIHARIPWTLLSSYNSNGYTGVIADEDKRRFATSQRSLIPDEVILPMFSDTGTRVSYTLEPAFAADAIDPVQNLDWDWARGQISIQVTGPDGRTVDLGTLRFVGKGSSGPTTKVAAVTAWKPPAYGRYSVRATGWIADRAGRVYEGGGTYRFWIAKRMTLATATFQGMAYPVGASYGRDIQFNPPFAADVQVTAKLFVNSSSSNVRSITYSGKASPAGIFGAAQGMKPFPLDAAGEYHAQILATYTDAEGALWVSTMRHAGIVYPADSPVVAHGKKLAIGGKFFERGETHDEGYADHLNHLTFPYDAGDVLLIAAEGEGANKIEPVLNYALKGDATVWDSKITGVGVSNLVIKTSNGYSPHLFPEFITDLEYYYGAAPRPGFMGRFLVGESTVRAPYWPVSPNSFGGQIGASKNGDQPGDIYRLIGGVVLRRAGSAPMYAGYLASAFLLPRGSGNNRVIAAGSEDLIGPIGNKARFFLVGLRPGTALEVGGTYRPAFQIDPMLPVAIHYELTYPDGRKQTADGTSDAAGSFAGPAAWPLDVPGIYRYTIRGSWNGFQGGMPGLPESGGEFYVYSKRPAGEPGLKIDGPTTQTFSPTTGLTISGTSKAATVHYSLLMPGAVIEIGEIPVRGGRFEYFFDPEVVHRKVPLYDITSVTSGNPQIGRVIHLSLFSEERTASGTFWDFTRVILRGTTALTPRPAAQ